MNDNVTPENNTNENQTEIPLMPEMPNIPDVPNPEINMPEIPNVPQAPSTEEKIMQNTQQTAQPQNFPPIENPAPQNRQGSPAPRPPYIPQPPYGFQPQYGPQPQYGSQPQYGQPPYYQQNGAVPPYTRPGFIPNGYVNPINHPKRNTAMTSLWLGIISLCMPCISLIIFIILTSIGGTEDNVIIAFGVYALSAFIGAVFGIIAIILSVSASKRGKLSTATAGLVTGIIGCVICLSTCLVCSCTCAITSVSSSDNYNSFYSEFYDQYSSGTNTFFIK